MLAGVQMNAVIGYVVIVPLVTVFWYENLGELLAKEPKKSFWLLAPVIQMITIGFFATFTPQFEQQKALMVLLYNFVLAAITLDLMLANMTKRAFSQGQWPLIFCAAPVLNHFLYGFIFSDEFNNNFVIAMLVCSALYFWLRMAIVCR